MYSFAQKKFALFPFVVFAIFPITGLISIQPSTKSQSLDQALKLAITRIGNAKISLNVETRTTPNPAKLFAARGFTFPYAFETIMSSPLLIERTKADSEIDCHVPIKAGFYTKC
ncbi:hypothetical protein [Pseudanabaena sp. Chao 1811]|uniref:hypothetical protein n=1 Tax=Pseudanabaena sp. Chao 1811 TaxID=2963092 RepID=UPI0022F3990E|nr:hypothetical protein [Pseudanabaena sp. Chao 1811]